VCFAPSQERNTIVKPIVGLHHVTAIASDPQRNLDFYTGVLGLRLVKRTVNFDDPGTYHFYFGDDTGTPGTILTFFPWPYARRGSPGNGETSATAFSVPSGSLPFWEQRLLAAGVPAERLASRFGDEVLGFADPDGMRLELVAHADAADLALSRFSDVPAEHALRGFFGVTLAEASLEATATVLQGIGLKKVAEDGPRHRFRAPGDAIAHTIDLLVQPRQAFGNMGAGSVHHIAFRAADDPTQQEWRTAIGNLGLHPTQTLDRTYFHSIYFREPGGVLFELATDTPGFAFDEPVETLGEGLKLPPWLEAQRPLIEAKVAPITLHHHRPSEEVLA
jgi:glyoxalase family protein